MAERGEPTRELFRLEDIRDFLALAAGGILATAVPAALDEAASAALLGLHRTLRPAELTAVAERIAAALPERRAEAPRLAAAHALMRLEDTWGRLREIGPRKWRPEIDLVGAERVVEARRRGRGVVLWCSRTASATAIKQAFFRAGMPLHHLSRVQHGARSTSRFATGVVSPLYCRAENPYLAERVKIPLGDSLAYLKTLRARLRANGCVSIFGEHSGRRNAQVPFLGLPRRFAVGAPSVAWAEEAALFTVHASRTGPFRYLISVDEEIPVDRSVDRKRFAARAAAVFARRLEAFIRASPADWQGWSYWGPDGPRERGD